MEEFKKNHKRIFQFAEYLFTGGIYFWVGYILLDYFYYGLHWNLWWSTIISSIIGWAVNYWLQRHWVFDNNELKVHQTRVTGRYAIITITDFFLNYLILFGLKKVGITPAIGQFVSAAFFTGWNYVWYRFWVFPDKADQREFKLTVARLLTYRPHGHSAFIRK